MATSAGCLPHKAIIHVAGIDWHWRATEKSFRLSTRNAFELARKMGFASLAYPLIGAGTGGMSKARVRELMVDALTSLEGPSVRVVEFAQ